MNIEKKLEGTTLTIALEGRLDTTTSPDLEEALAASLDGVTALVFDFAKLDYLSSAGLRVLRAEAHEQAGLDEARPRERRGEGGLRDHRLL